MKNYISLSAKIFVSSMIFVWIVAIYVFGVSAQEIDVNETRGLIEAISDAGSYLPEDIEQPMTRRDFVIAAAEVFAPGVTGSDVSFEDVDKEDPLYAALCKAVNLGWITESQYFRPDDVIQLGEAAKIACIIAGYDVRAQLAGGYPNGYLNTANRIKITDSALSGADELTVAQGIEIMGNTLMCEKLDVTSYGGDSNTYAVREGETVLADLYNIYYTEGIINATEYSAFGKADGKGDIGYVQIDGVTYKSSDVAINEYLGYNVTGYYILNNSGKNELVFAYPTENDVLNLYAKDTVFDKENLRIAYGDSKIKYAKLKAGFEYIYNGRVVYDPEYIKLPEDGYVILVDNDNDDYYDVVKVKECYYLEVGAVNKYYYTITDKYDKDKSLDFSDQDSKYVLLDGDGQEISIAGVKKGNVYAVYASVDRQLVTLQLCDESVTGKLTAIDNSEKMVAVDDVDYRVSPEFETKFLDKITLGSNYEFILGVYGEVIKTTSTDELWFYAYLIDAKKSAGMEDSYMIKVFTDKAEHREYVLADKVASGNKKNTDEKTYELIAPDDIVTPQLIKIRTDSDGKINGLSMAEVKKEFDFNTQQKENELYEYDFGVSSYYFYNNHMYPNFNIDSCTIFKIPKTNTADENGYSIGHTFANGSTKDLKPYDIDMNGSARALVFVTDDKIPTLTSSTTALVVEKVSRALDSDGNDATKVYAYDNGVYVEYYLHDSCVVKKNGVTSSLGTGDIIRANISGDYIMSLTVDFNGSSLLKDSGSTVKFNSSAQAYQYHTGSVYSVGDGYMYISNTKAADGISYDYSMASLINIKLPAKYIVCDVNDKTIRPADASYIRSFVSNGTDASYVVVHQSYLNGKCCVIYQDE